MPIVRGRFIPEVENAGRVKHYFDVLLWGDNWSNGASSDLDEIEVLREYLSTLRPAPCCIRLLVPIMHEQTIRWLEALSCRFDKVEIFAPSAEITRRIGDPELATATQTAIRHDADTLVVSNRVWLPYIEDLEKLGVFISDTSFLKRRCEVFVRGHDAPWAFGTPQIWNLTWTAFYHVTEALTFRAGMQLLHAAQQKNVDAEGRETGRSLVFNRLPNICYTRDRLLFYDVQKLISIRNGWTRQVFDFEIGYYLNVYYLLIYGGFDQLALVVNQILKLGLPERKVGATYRNFLDALQAKSASLYTIFSKTEHTDFIKRIGALRHFASHRGSVMPGKLIERPEKEPTDEELDTEIAEAGADGFLRLLPEGDLRRSLQETLRQNFRIAHYEAHGTVIDGVQPIVIDGKNAFIQPLVDTAWNFTRFMFFANDVFLELENHL